MSVAKKYMIRICTMLICGVFLATVWSGMGPVHAGNLNQGDQGAQAGRITLAYELPDTSFRLYRVAEGDGRGNWAITQAFREYAVDQEVLLGAGSPQIGPDQVRSLVEALAAYVNRDGLEATQTGKTGGYGILSFEGLESGIYLILGDAGSRDGYRYTPSPALVWEPGVTESGDRIHDLQVQIKYAREKEPEGDPAISILAYKVWKDNGSSQRPVSVEVELLRDGISQGIYTLNEANHWRWEWTNLPAGYLYQVVEKSVPAGYRVGVERSGNTFVVTNTLIETPPPQNPPSQNPPPPTSPGEVLGAIFRPGGEVLSGRIPQTGQIWWPVAVLAGAGIYCLVVGIRKRKGRGTGR